jgi:magnesium-transporting ATPase (P-type)
MTQFHSLNSHKEIILFYSLTVVSLSLFEHLMSLSFDKDRINAIKHGPLNQIFAKFAWGWTLSGSLLLLIVDIIRFILRRTEKTATHIISALKHHISSITIISTSTLYWILLTQWFFGPSLMTRIFQTNGSCMPRSNYNANTVSLLKYEQCTRNGHKWNGFDVSGHVLY